MSNDIKGRGENILARNDFELPMNNRNKMFERDDEPPSHQQF